MAGLFGNICEYFDNDGWMFHRFEEESYLSLSVSTESGDWGCQAIIDEENGLVFFYSICPIKAPADRRVKAAEFLMRVNRRAYVGHFLMDFDSGEIRYETLMHTSDDVNLNAEMEATVGCNLAMMTKYLPGILRVLSSSITPEEAIAEIGTGNAVMQSYMLN